MVGDQGPREALRPRTALPQGRPHLGVGYRETEQRNEGRAGVSCSLGPSLCPNVLTAFSEVASAVVSHHTYLVT
jgi:hypothetical protein